MVCCGWFPQMEWTRSCFPTRCGVLLSDSRREGSWSSKWGDGVWWWYCKPAGGIRNRIPGNACAHLKWKDYQWATITISYYLTKVISFVSDLFSVWLFSCIITGCPNTKACPPFCHAEFITDWLSPNGNISGALVPHWIPAILVFSPLIIN